MESVSIGVGPAQRSGELRADGGLSAARYTHQQHELRVHRRPLAAISGYNRLASKLTSLPLVTCRPTSVKPWLA